MFYASAVHKTCEWVLSFRGNKVHTTHTPGRTRGGYVHFYTLYHLRPIFKYLVLYCDLFALPTRVRVDLMWTFYKRDRRRRQKNGWNVRLKRARSCVPWLICLRCPFKLPPQSPALLLWLASAGSVASSRNVTWDSQCLIVCSEMPNFLLNPLQVTMNIVFHCWCCGCDWSWHVCLQVGLSSKHIVVQKNPKNPSAKFHKKAAQIYVWDICYPSCMSVRCQHSYMSTTQPMNKYILSLMQTHPTHSLSHFINNAYMQGL